MDNIRLILPMRLPTWNSLLAMNHWERKKIRDLIKGAVSMCIQEQIVSPTRTGAPLKPSSMALWKLEYYEAMTPNASRKYRNRKKKLKAKSKQS